MTSLCYILADITAVCSLFLLGAKIQTVPYWGLRWTLYTLYGVVQGLFFTGIWILAHECGHTALFTGRLLNDMFGFMLHSCLLVPYFSWKYTHARHHRFANNMEKDTAFVPARTGGFSLTEKVQRVLELGEDAPILNVAVLAGHQLLGWPLYLLFGISAGEKSLQNSQRSLSSKRSHLDPTGDLFRPAEHPFVLLSDIGIAAVAYALYATSQGVGAWNVALLYGLPYLWVNNWIVAITYLHHNHPDASHFEAEAWTFQKGALMTVDRDFGLIGKHLFHGIIEFHVVHHLFSRIPFYHAEEATEHIQGLLGSHYIREKQSFWRAMWETFTSCKFVEPSKTEVGVLVWAPRAAESNSRNKV